MRAHNFKIGDIVKLKPDFTHRFSQGTKIGEVLRFSGKYIRVKYAGKLYDFPYLPNEIEHVIKVGEQLKFAFMKG